MTEGSSDALRPEAIIIRGPELEEAEEEVVLDDEGLPPPVKAVTQVEAPHTPAGGHLQVRIGVSLLAAFMLLFLFLDLVPETDRGSSRPVRRLLTRVWDVLPRCGCKQRPTKEIPTKNSRHRQSTH